MHHCRKVITVCTSDTNLTMRTFLFTDVMRRPLCSSRLPALVGSVRVSTAAFRAAGFALCAMALVCLPIVPIDSCRAQTGETPCRPTPPDSMGPFYEPDAPQRDSVGSGYRLEGVVRSARTCRPVADARIELWMAGPDGRYDDDFRATVYAKKDGAYRFESHKPVGYYGRPPHIHMRVSAEGFETLITQHYPQRGARQGTFDLVLRPQP